MDTNFTGHHMMVANEMNYENAGFMDVDVDFGFCGPAIAMAVRNVLDMVPDDENTSIGVTCVISRKMYAMTRMWNRGDAENFEFVADLPGGTDHLVDANILMLSSDGDPIIVEGDEDSIRAGFIDRHGDSHFVRIILAD